MILLTAFDYDHSEHPTIPFAVTPVDVESLYGANFDVQLVRELDLDQTLKQLQLREKKGNFQPWTLSRFAKSTICSKRSKSVTRHLCMHCTLQPLKRLSY